MYIYNKPHVHPPQQGTGADGRAMKTLPDPTQPSLSQNPSSSSPSSLLPPLLHPHPPPSSASASVSASASAAAAAATISVYRPAKDRRNSLPFSFPPLFGGPSNASSTSLVPSTAEGRPIPLDDTTAAHRTSALRELNSNYPSPVSRHRYAKSTGAKSTTYSQPVIVRTYSGPSPSNHSYSNSTRYRPPSASRIASRRVPLSSTSSVAAATAIAPGSGSLFGPPPFSKPSGGVGVSSIGKHASGGGGLLSMARAKAKKKLPWQWIAGGGADEDDENKLPPLEAFSFKSIMSDMQGDDDVNADLDRIAEICARSRYSLSNQYEVHVAPHGSGSSFVAAGHASSSRRRRDHHHHHHHRHPHNHHHHGPHRGEAGPTLQAVPSDDDESGARTHRKRRSGGRRKSMAYGTLETIMSSSRSSEEDKSKKPPAAEIADDVRGRARKGSDPPTGSGSGSTTKAEAGGEPNGAARSKSKEGAKKPARQKSTSFAHAVIIDGTRHASGADAAQPRNSASALVSGPALPQTSSSHFGVRTAPDAPPYQDTYRDAHPPESPTESGTESPLSEGLPHLEDPTPSSTGLLSGFHAWVPWMNNGTGGPPSDRRGTSQASHAAGSLRELLKTVEGKQSKGKGVDRDG